MKSQPPPGKRERNPEETRRRILDAAETEFARKGYDGTRLRDVADTVGVNHALLHHYFKDKEGLFRAVLERAIESISTQALEVLRSPDEIPTLSRKIVETVISFLAENHKLALILHLSSLDEGSLAYSICEEIGFRFVKPLFDAATQVVESAQSAGVLRNDMDAHAIIMAGLGAAAFPFHVDKLIVGLLGRDPRSPEEVRRHREAAVAVILEGVLAKRK